MNRRVFAASTLSSALGLALAMAAAPGLAQPKEMPQVVKDNMARMEKSKLEKCYGINAVAKNDCAEGAHSCAGQATQARDAKSFVLLPAGDCSKIHLLPLPMTEEALVIVCSHVDHVQSVLKRRILVENPSTYLRFCHSTTPEWEFLAEVARRTGCGILCDVNNIYVSACNHGWEASVYLGALPPAAIGEIHLAGHSVRQLEQGRTLRIDDHGSRVAPEVWALYEEALQCFGPVPTLIEWDTGVPAFDVLMEEAAIAEAVLKRQGNARPSSHAA